MKGLTNTAMPGDGYYLNPEHAWTVGSRLDSLLQRLVAVL